MSHRRKRINWIIENHKTTIQNYLELMEEYEAKYGIISERPKDITDEEEWELLSEIQQKINQIKEDYMDEFLASPNVALNSLGIARRLIERGKI